MRILYLAVIFIILPLQNIYGQLELEELYYLRELEILKNNKVKEKITFVKINNEFEKIKTEYFSNEGRIDSIKSVHPMWCSPCIFNTDGSLSKKWQTIKFEYQNNSRKTFYEDRFIEEEKKLLNINDILKLIYSRSSEVDTIKFGNTKSITRYENSANIISNSFLDSTQTIILKTVLNYDKNYNILSKLYFTNYPNTTSNTANNSYINYYFYNSDELRIKEISEKLGINKCQITEFEYNSRCLLIKKKVDSEIFKIQYQYY